MAISKPVQPPLTLGQRLRNWKEITDTCNLSRHQPMDLVSRWLIVTRACVFQMSLTSGLIGGLLGASAGSINWLYFALALLGLLSAHAANNLSNDFFDLQEGLDTRDYPRALYAPHPVLSGLVTQRGLAAAFLGLTALDACIAVYLTLVRGPLVLFFAAAGFLISLFYSAWPIKLKYHALGELGVFVVWGPLMIGGTYYVAAGEIAPWVLLASLPYALAVTTVILGKHLDKYAYDQPRGVHTLPVLIGQRGGVLLNQALMVLFYVVSLALVLGGALSVWVLLVSLSLPRLMTVWQIYAQPRPAQPPANYPVWPLWFVSWAFYWTKQAGTLLVTGLILGLIFPVKLTF